MEFTHNNHNKTTEILHPNSEISSDDGLDKAADTEIDLISPLIEGVDSGTVDDTLLEDLVDKHPTIQAMLGDLQIARKSGVLAQDTEKGMVEEIRQKRSEVARQLKNALNINIGTEEDTGKNDDRQIEANRLRALGEVLSTITGKETEDELLAKYKLIDDSGMMTHESLHSPLFKIDTTLAFNDYINYVKQFEILSQAEVTAGRRLRNTQEADVIRREAHDAVARLVERDLGLPFDNARRFIAKAREAVVPSSYEKISYAQLLRGEKLAAKFGGDAADFTKNSLRRVIESPMPHEIV